MTEYESLVRKEMEATIDRAGFETLDPETGRVDVTDSFRRKLGECRVIAPSDCEANREYEGVRASA